LTRVDRIAEQKLWESLNTKTKRGAMALMDNVIFQDGRAFSTETGEEVTHLVDVSLKTTGEQVRALEGIDELTKHEIENGKFIFMFFKTLSTMEERFPALTKQDTARLLYLATFIAWETGRLQSDNGKKHYIKKDVERMVEMSTKRFNEFFKRLEQEDILHEAGTGELFINPTVFYRGKLASNLFDISYLEYTRLFRTTIRNLYQEFKGRKLAQLAVVYSVIPFLSLHYNIVCHNPKETSEDLIEPMELSELATVLGYVDASSLKRSLNRIKVEGKPVFAFVENPHDRRTYRIIVNPRVVYAGGAESLRAIKALFN